MAGYGDEERGHFMNALSWSLFGLALCISLLKACHLQISWCEEPVVTALRPLSRLLDNAKIGVDDAFMSLATVLCD